MKTEEDIDLKLKKELQNSASTVPKTPEHLLRSIQASIDNSKDKPSVSFFSQFFPVAFSFSCLALLVSTYAPQPSLSNNNNVELALYILDSYESAYSGIDPDLLDAELLDSENEIWEEAI